jgi:outer membrane lipopolysaccharide assembly protein LptE/RlpB
MVFKNADLSIKLDELGGNSKINHIIKNRLKIYEEKNNNYNLEIVDSNINKIVTSMDTKGNPKSYQLSVELIINLKENTNIIIKDKNFIVTTNYNTISSKFDLKKYENNLIKNLTEKISYKIILYIQSL